MMWGFREWQQVARLTNTKLGCCKNQGRYVLHTVCRTAGHQPN